MNVQFEAQIIVHKRYNCSCRGQENICNIGVKTELFHPSSGGFDIGRLSAFGPRSDLGRAGEGVTRSLLGV